MKSDAKNNKSKKGGNKNKSLKQVNDLAKNKSKSKKEVVKTKEKAKVRGFSGFIRSLGPKRCGPVFDVVRMIIY